MGLQMFDNVIMLEVALGVSVLATMGLAIAWFYKWHQNRALKNKINVQDNAYKRLLGQKKSSEVRLGRIAENMAPFFDSWPYNANTFRFIGSPIDGIQFTKEEVIFVEIKTGKSRLSSGQKHIKRLVKEGKVSFVTFKIGDDGVSLKKDMSEREE